MLSVKEARRQEAREQNLTKKKPSARVLRLWNQQTKRKNSSKDSEYVTKATKQMAWMLANKEERKQADQNTPIKQASNQENTNKS